MKNLAEIYVGTYYSEKSKGIYRFTFDTERGQMTEPELFYRADNAKWVSVEGNTMAVPIERAGRAGTCFLEVREGSVCSSEEILEEKQTPCYILQKGSYVYTANYHEGNVMVYHLEKGKPTLVKRIENGNEAGCHQIMLHDTCLLVPCLAQDRIRLFDITHDFIPAGEILFPKGSGPRHGVFNRSHSRLYVVSEWSNELFVFAVRGKEFRLLQIVSVLPDEIQEDENAAAAAIRLTRDERFLYISVRGADIITAFEIKENEAVVLQHVFCGGQHPRDCILSEDERFLLSVNRFAGGIVSMERDEESGLLGNIKHRVSMPEGVALVYAEEVII